MPDTVARYIDLVFSTAMRLVEGDAHRAEDVGQTVFADLARQARTLSPKVMLGGWLHRRTCHAAATLMRGERRRKIREREAAEMNELERVDEARYEQVAPLSFILYARDHDDLIPESFEQAAGVQGSEALLEFDTNQFEIVYRGTLQGVADPGNTLIFRELQARQSPSGEWVKVYGLADGSTVTHTEADEEAFEAWEKARLPGHP